MVKKQNSKDYQEEEILISFILQRTNNVYNIVVYRFNLKKTIFIWRISQNIYVIYNMT